MTFSAFANMHTVEMYVLYDAERKPKIYFSNKEQTCCNSPRNWLAAIFAGNIACQLRSHQNARRYGALTLLSVLHHHNAPKKHQQFPFPLQKKRSFVNFLGFFFLFFFVLFFLFFFGGGGLLFCLSRWTVEGVLSLQPTKATGPGCHLILLSVSLVSWCWKR